MLRSYTTRTSRPVSIIPDVIAIGVDDQPPAVIPRACAQELFTFSPFGLSCRQCAKQVQIKLDERSIRDHLKKHCIDSRISTVRSILFEFTKQVDLAKATGTMLYCGQIVLLWKDKSTFMFMQIYYVDVIKTDRKATKLKHWMYALKH
jgi:hypothetical protein